MITQTKNKFLENRGSNYTIYDYRDYDIEFVQDKISKSFQGVIRGFHGDHKTWKLITCLYGKIKLVTYDIETDERNEFFLDGDDKDSVSVLVQPGVLNAHQCLSLNCIFHYKCSEYYTSPEDQFSIHYNDKTINPRWFNLPPIVSERDKNSKSLQDFKNA